MRRSPPTRRTVLGDRDGRGARAPAGTQIDVFKYKNKTGYKRRQGHRQEQTIVKVTGIELGA